jgi:hypothetical protein
MERRFRNAGMRVTYYERKMARCLKALERLEAAADHCRALRGDIEELKRYYTSREWMDDFEADEAGLFPEDMKRGVLSEDGIDGLLSRYGEIQALLEDENETL